MEFPGSTGNSDAKCGLRVRSQLTKAPLGCILILLIEGPVVCHWQLARAVLVPFTYGR